MISMMTALLVLAFILLFLDIAAPLLLMLGLVILAIVVIGVSIATTPSKNRDTEQPFGHETPCPHGYTCGCHPVCPMYEHCWQRHTEQNDDCDYLHHLSSDCHTSTTFDEAEDGDWRTTYMDDTLYDERDYDEQHDRDRFDNGGW
ncbi:MAG: hypothetical protein IKA70_04845 [Alistipes sp.]|nr:hypothetical protein [Alistipes sp.]